MRTFVTTAMVFTVVSLAGTVIAAQTSGLQGWNYEPLRDDLRLDELLDRPVLGTDGQTIGNIRDVLVNDAGKFEAVAIEFDHGGGSGFAIAKMEWSDTSFGPDNNAVSVSMDWRDDGSDAAGRAADAPVGNGIPAREIVGMPVHLAQKMFGRVEDFLVDGNTRQPSAVLVARHGETYAIPVKGMNVNRGGGYVSFPYTAQDVQSMGAFDRRGSSASE